MKRLLIEEWLPIEALGVESLRERTPMTPFPAPNRLHVWFARRPLVASRAAVLAGLLPADASREKFLHLLGIHGDPMAAKLRMSDANRDEVRLKGNPYGYERAFKYQPNTEELEWVNVSTGRDGFVPATVLDPTAGGGSIPFETVRLGFRSIAIDLNPVATLLLRATVEFPSEYGPALMRRFREVAARFVALAQPKFAGMFPPESPGHTVDGYLWVRTVTCPYCGGLVPLFAPHGRLTERARAFASRPTFKRGAVPLKSFRPPATTAMARLKMVRASAHSPIADASSRVLKSRSKRNKAAWGTNFTRSSTGARAQAGPNQVRRKPDVTEPSEPRARRTILIP